MIMYKERNNRPSSGNLKSQVHSTKPGIRYHTEDNTNARETPSMRNR